MPEQNRSPRAVEDCHALIGWMIPQLDRFPRSRRFTVGARLESALLEVLEALCEAAWSGARGREAALRLANRRLQVARYLWRLANEMQLVSRRRFGHGAELMVLLGRQIGGWLRSARGAA